MPIRLLDLPRKTKFVGFGTNWETSSVRVRSKPGLSHWLAADEDGAVATERASEAASTSTGVSRTIAPRHVRTPALAPSIAAVHHKDADKSRQWVLRIIFVGVG